MPLGRLNRRQHDEAKGARYHRGNPIHGRTRPIGRRERRPVSRMRADATTAPGAILGKVSEPGAEDKSQLVVFVTLQ